MYKTQSRFLTKYPNRFVFYTIYCGRIALFCNFFCEIIKKVTKYYKMVTKYQAVPPPFYIYSTEKMYKLFLFFPPIAKRKSREKRAGRAV